MSPKPQIHNNMTADNEETQLLASPTSTLNARTAFENNDESESRKFHDIRHVNGDGLGDGSNNEDFHQSEGGFLKPIIFGGLDGILTSFAIVAGASGGNLSPAVILILGFSNIFADALSMGVGEFLSSKANNEWILSERKREEWEMANYPQGEINEMIDIYMKRGMSLEDATQVITTMAKYEDFFVDVMMQQELELQVPEPDHVKESCKEGVVMFFSFAFFGALPLLGYVIMPVLFPELEEGFLFVTACIITGLVLFFMGSIKSIFCTQHWILSGMETLLLGGACATLAYTIGYFVNELVTTDEADL